MSTNVRMTCLFDLSQAAPERELEESAHTPESMGATKKVAIHVSVVDVACTRAYSPYVTCDRCKLSLLHGRRCTRRVAHDSSADPLRVIRPT